MLKAKEITNSLNDVMEKAYGKIAVVYTRIWSDFHLKNLVSSGFKKPHNYDDYGRGIYACYNFASQQRKKMVTVGGEYVVKAKLNLDGFIILDYKIAKIVYKDKYNIIDQIVGISNRITNLDYTELNQIHKKLKNLKNKTVTEDLAKKIVKSKFKKYCRGIVFNHHYDGIVAYVYNPETLIPISYIESKGINLKKKNSSNFKWMDIKNANLISKGLFNQLSDIENGPEIIGKKFKDGSILDNRTGIIWNKASDDMMSWYDAVEFAKNCIVGGKKNWRLPTVKEIEDTDDYHKEIGIGMGNYWTSVVNKNNENEAYTYKPKYGLSFNRKDMANFVMVVKVK